MENNEISEKIKEEIISEIRKTVKKLPLFQRKMTEKVIKTIKKFDIKITCECDIVTAEVKSDFFNHSVSRKVSDLNMGADYFPEKREFIIEITSNEIYE